MLSCTLMTSYKLLKCPKTNIGSYFTMILIKGSLHIDHINIDFHVSAYLKRIYISLSLHEPKLSDEKWFNTLECKKRYFRKNYCVKSPFRLIDWTTEANVRKVLNTFRKTFSTAISYVVLYVHSTDRARYCPVPMFSQYIHAYLLYITLYYYYYYCTITFSAKLSQHCLPRSQLLLLTVCQRYCSLKLWKAGGFCVVLCNECSGRSI